MKKGRKGLDLPSLVLFGHFSTDLRILKSYHISTTDAQVQAMRGTADADLEQVFLEEIPRHQLLHVTFWAVLTKGQTSAGRSYIEKSL